MTTQRVRELMREYGVSEAIAQDMATAEAGGDIDVQIEPGTEGMDAPRGEEGGRDVGGRPKEA